MITTKTNKHKQLLVRGKMPSRQSKKVLMAIDHNDVDRIKRELTGAMSGAIIGLIDYGLDVLEKNGGAFVFHASDVFKNNKIDETVNQRVELTENDEQKLVVCDKLAWGNPRFQIILPLYVFDKIKSKTKGATSGAIVGLIHYGIERLRATNKQLDVRNDIINASLANQDQSGGKDMADNDDTTVHYTVTPSSEITIGVKGRIARKNVHQMIIPLPPELHEKLVKYTNGPISGAMTGLVMYALDELDKQGLGLTIQLPN